MQTLIVTDNPRKAEFVKRGLKYENLTADIVEMRDASLVRNYVLFYDGIFILSDDDGMINCALGMIQDMPDKPPLIVLTDSMTRQLSEVKKIPFIHRIFIRPFSFGSIAAEMRFSVFKKNNKTENGRLVLRDLEMDIVRHEVKLGDRRIQLRHREFALLQYLMMNSGKVLSRTSILENVWDRNSNILTNTVDVHISHLRKKLEKNSNKKYIYTIPCTGYLLS